MNIVGGYLNDLFSKKYNLMLAIACYSIVSTLGLALSTSGTMIGFWRAVMAIGLSWGTTTILTILALTTTGGIRGSIYGIQKMFFWAGISLAGFASPLLLVYMGYKTTMITMTILGLVGLILVVLYVKDSVQEQNSKSISPHALIKKKGFDLGAEMTALSYVGFVAKYVEDGIITTFIPLFLLMEFGSSIQVGITIGLHTIFYAIFQPIGGIVVGIIVSTIIGLYCMVVLTGMGSGINASVAEARASLIVSNESKAIGYWGLAFFSGHWVFYRPNYCWSIYIGV